MRRLTQAATPKRVLGTLAVTVALVAAFFIGRATDSDGDARAVVEGTEDGGGSGTTTSLAGDDGDDDPVDDADDDADVDDAGPPTGDVAGSGAPELLELLDAGSERTFHARYVLTGGEAAGAGSDIGLELWSGPPNARRDTSLVVGGEQIFVRELRLEDGAVRCVRQGEEWQCERQEEDLDARELLFGSILDELPGTTVTVADGTVAGHAARCFTIVGGSVPTQELCLSDVGVPLSIDSGGARLEVESLEDAPVPADTFVPPAAVS